MERKFKNPQNASERFANQSYEREDDHYESVLDNENAAYAAKPWMDVATRLHDSKIAVAMDDDIELGLDNLVVYAERRAHQAAMGERGDELTADEQALLDVFTAEADMHEADAGWNHDDLTNDLVGAAIYAARDKAKAARAAGDRDQAHYWQQIATRAEEYEELIFDGVGDRDRLDEDEHDELSKKVIPSADMAGFELEFGLQEGHLTNRQMMEVVHKQAVDMRKTAELYKLFAEIQSSQHAEQETGQSEVGSEAPLQRVDLAESRVEAKELVFSNPELLDELYQEAGAYNTYLIDHRAEFVSATERFDVELRRFEKRRGGLETALNNWKNDSLGFLAFDEYVTAIDNGEVEVSEDVETAANDALSVMRSKAWKDRLSATQRRLCRRDTDKSELGMQLAFSQEYFG